MAQLLALVGAAVLPSAGYDFDALVVAAGMHCIAADASEAFAGDASQVRLEKG